MWTTAAQVCVLLAVVCAYHDHSHSHSHGHDYEGQSPAAAVSGGTRPTPPVAPPASPAPSSSPASSAPPIARSPSGSFLGSWMTSRRGRRFQAFRGIKYAEAPVGELRFQPPKPILQYSSEVNATVDGPACPLLAPDDYFVSEDCLTINVYTPDAKSSKPLPVLFFIHAGGFYSMTGRSDVAGPNHLLDRDLVLVTINYRLSSLGFMSTGDKLAPGNNGMKDQVVALRWVQRNIAAFGGDPGLVTISGCSAGSISVMLHMISPMSKGLFHRGISMSASPVSKAPSPTQQYELAVKQARLLNCPSDNSSVIIACLKTKSSKELGDWRGFYEFGLDPTGIWWPVVEPDFGQERFLTQEPLDAIQQGKMHDVPYILSQTEDEFFWQAFTILNNSTLLTTMNAEWSRVAPISFGLPRGDALQAERLRQAYLGGRPLKNDTQTARDLGKLYGDAVVGFGVHRLANLMCRHSKHRVWYYEFSYIGNNSHYEDPVTKKPTGAAHHDDLIYVFSLPYRFPALPADDSPDSRLVDQMTALFYNFARYGDPNPRGDTPELGGLVWPAMTPTARSFLRVDRQLAVQQNMKEDRMAVWEELYPINY